MSGEVMMNGGNSEIRHQQQEPLMDGIERSVVQTTAAPPAIKLIGAEQTDFFSETVRTNNNQVATACSGSGLGSGSRSQKSKRRQNQKTLMDIFHMHERIGSWADAAAADAHTTTYLPSTAQDSSDALQRVSATQQGDCNQYHNTDGNLRLSSIGIDRATHSRNVDFTHLPDRPPFEVKVTNINYKSSDNDLFCFFGGEGSVVNIRSEGQAARRGIAVVSLSSQEALMNALKLNNMELQGRSLRISLQEHQSRPSFAISRASLQDHQLRLSFGSGNIGPNDAFVPYRNNGSCHEGGYSTLPHPGRGPSQILFHACNSVGRTNRLSLQHYSSNRGRDNRRYEYDSRQFRYPKPENSQIVRFVSRGSDSYGMSSRSSASSENHSLHHNVETELDANKRSSARIRKESVRSNTTDGSEKHERRRLQLQPRTKPLSTSDDLPARPTNIFGLAKPVDTYEKEKQVEERLRLENEALKTAEQRSRKNSERAVSVSVSPALIHGQVSLMTKSSLNESMDHENPSSPVQKTVAKANCKSVEGGEKVRTTSVAFPLVTQLVSSEDRVVGQAETCVTASSSAPHFPHPLSEPSISTVRRQSFSNCAEMPETRASTTLLRTRNNYNRTFIRSRDSVQTQLPANRLNNIPVHRGKSGSRRSVSGKGLGSNKDKHFIANTEKFTVEHGTGGSSVEPIVRNGAKETENEPNTKQLMTPKEENREFTTKLGANAMTTKQSWQKHSDQQYSKKEKKKQTAAAKEMLKYVERKPFTFSSENKYAALLEADE